ncbi:Aspartyl-tRNA(Asn) amidotransferase subunit B @ Glutamyl-tRNA(Gln) amidotransferase subunit B [hydrothermal vent metagenome]|uniref:Aspartyl-tRNA(Asn) amidotransferase subunit B @ Glutamyl-tRNA(Gln) amidotransferase subunit B n=1 Tax=hydrothermal vent metagenome TaxID=652676 RepID=A0A1W1C871_9ZZZZ
MEWETVIGLEIHAQLATKTKIFSGAATKFGAPANTQACAVDLGLPGVLPVLNKEAVFMAVKFGLGINANINRRNVFARKNYFYPDLPKGYQISQMELPIVGEGSLDIEVDNKIKTIGITRAHLEEDAGKSIHDIFENESAIDLNRAGIPLLEIVSEPDMRSSAEAVAYAKKIHALVQYLEICDGNMQEGSFRCDANISLRPVGQKEFGTRAEIKNINSFKFLEKAIEYEVERQAEVLENGGKVVQETRLYDSIKDETRSMRSKEEANDYRYFPDPDLLPLDLDEAIFELAKKDLPELPDVKKARFINDYGLTDYDASILINDIELANYFEQVVKVSKSDAKLCANWVIGDLLGLLKKEETTLKQTLINADELGLMISRISDNTISGKIAKDVFLAMASGEGNADKIIEKKGLKQITDSATIEKIIDEVISNNQKQLEQYRSGNEKLFGFFVGQVMKASQGKANPAEVNKLLKTKL